MSLRDEIRPFLDKFNLVTIDRISSSGNGVMYTGEYYSLLKKNNELTSVDPADFAATISHCIDNKGLLNRSPISKDQEGIDDYLGVLSACKNLEIQSLPRMFLKSFLMFLGFMNNQNPGFPSFSSFLGRYPQFISCLIASAFPSKFNPLHILIRLLAFPFFFVTSLILLVNSLNSNGSADSKRLAWHVLECTESVSILCYLASKLWRKSLFRFYGSQGMLAVAKNYYGEYHPFSKYWVNK